jgi:sialic acid synthase SpsE
LQVACAAVALGADLVEKHFTLDRSMPGPDHRASLEPAELRELVRDIRDVEAISKVLFTMAVKMAVSWKTTSFTSATTKATRKKPIQMTLRTMESRGGGAEG